MSPERSATALSPRLVKPDRGQAELSTYTISISISIAENNHRPFIRNAWTISSYVPYQTKRTLYPEFHRTDLLLYTTRSCILANHQQQQKLFSVPDCFSIKADVWMLMTLFDTEDNKDKYKGGVFKWTLVNRPPMVPCPSAVTVQRTYKEGTLCVLHEMFGCSIKTPSGFA